MDGRQMIGGRFTFVFGLVPAVTLDVEEAAEDGAWVRGEMIDRTSSDDGQTATVNLANVLYAKDVGE
jgi:hypothetical protein